MYTPWGDEDSPALVTAVETTRGRTLSVQLMHCGRKPAISTLEVGDTLARQGEPGSDLNLVLDGVVRVDGDGEQLAEVGPGAILGERAHLEGGIRAATLVVATACRVAAVPASQFDPAALAELTTDHCPADLGPGPASTTTRPWNWPATPTS